MEAERRILIVNADDFGQSPGVNRGVIVACEQGIVTSASLMVRWPASVEAAAYGRANPRLSLGLHVDLAEWTYRDGAWLSLYEVVAVGDRGAVAAEIRRQIEGFRELVGKSPTHLDSHQHVHRRDPVRSLMIEAARELRVPLREVSPGIRFCGDFYGQAATGEPLPDRISVEGLLGILAALPPGVTELACHPGEGEDLDTMYRAGRAAEVRALSDPRIRAALTARAIELGSFDDVLLPPFPGRHSGNASGWGCINDLHPVGSKAPPQTGDVYGGTEIKKI